MLSRILLSNKQLTKILLNHTKLLKGTAEVSKIVGLVSYFFIKIYFEIVFRTIHQKKLWQKLKNISV